MASVYERNRRWYLRIKDSRGRWVHKVSAARTKTEAKHLAWALERRFEHERLGLAGKPHEAASAAPTPRACSMSRVAGTVSGRAVRDVGGLSHDEQPTLRCHPEPARRIREIRGRLIGFEPTPSWSRTGERGRPDPTSSSQPVDIARPDTPERIQPSQVLSPISKNFTTRLLTDSAVGQVLSQLTADLLSVADVAARLRVSTATVYALVDRGELRHVRVSNAIRISPADLAAFVQASRRSGAPPG